jgi:hypothetical protein
MADIIDNKKINGKQIEKFIVLDFVILVGVLIVF